MEKRPSPWVFVFGFALFSLFTGFCYQGGVMPASFAIAAPLCVLVFGAVVLNIPMSKVIFDLQRREVSFVGKDVPSEKMSFDEIEALEIQTVPNYGSRQTVFKLRAVRGERASHFLFTSDVYEAVVDRAERISRATKIEFRDAEEAKRQVPRKVLNRMVYLSGIVGTSILYLVIARCSS